MSAAEPLKLLASAGKGKSTRSVLRVAILVLIAGAAVASRLFSVIRTCPFVSPGQPGQLRILHVAGCVFVLNVLTSVLWMWC